MIADTDHDKCSAFIYIILLVYLQRKMNSMKIIYHLNLVILSCLILLSKGMMCTKKNLKIDKSPA